MVGPARDILLGPFGASTRVAKSVGVFVVVALTVFTQLGGLLLWPFYTLTERWAARQPTRARRIAVHAAALLLVYLTLSQTVARAVGWSIGRAPLPLIATEAAPLGPRSLVLALAMRNYVVTDLRDVLIGASQRTAAAHPGTVVRYLDAGFPLPGWLLPHLSHGDGRKVDIAFLYEADGIDVDATPSPLGYWGYVQPSGPAERAAWAERAVRCAGVGYDVPVLGRVPLRWDFDVLQRGWPALTLDRPRTQRLLREVAADQRVKLILLEPTLHTALAAPKLQANSCRVARHDDHAHVELRSEPPERRDEGSAPGGVNDKAGRVGTPGGSVNLDTTSAGLIVLAGPPTREAFLTGFWQWVELLAQIESDRAVHALWWSRYPPPADGFLKRYQTFYKSTDRPWAGAFLAFRLYRDRDLSVASEIAFSSITSVVAIAPVWGVVRGHFVVHFLEPDVPRRRLIILPGALEDGQREFEHARDSLSAVGLGVV